MHVKSPIISCSVKLPMAKTAQMGFNLLQNEQHRLVSSVRSVVSKTNKDRLRNKITSKLPPKPITGNRKCSTMCDISFGWWEIPKGDNQHLITLSYLLLVIWLSSDVNLPQFLVLHLELIKQIQPVSSVTFVLTCLTYMPSLAHKM